MLSQKYGRTYHYPFSPGTTSDDRINHTYWEDIQRIETLVHTEKLDGENNCLNHWGVFARSHVAPTTSPWTSQLRERWQLLKNDLADIELFGENLYAIHSIEYQRIEEYYYIFAVRCLDKWLSWEEVKFYAALFDFPTVPELQMQSTRELTEESLKKQIIDWAQEPSFFGSVDPLTQEDCTREGVVSRNIGEYPVTDFPHQVFKYVRKGHVRTDVHWTRNWKRAKLTWENYPKMEE
ncbi:MAG: RNA ligase family protein [Bacteroides sp.]|nr:RNA ligase family protein [Bacteroides sp.]